MSLSQTEIFGFSADLITLLENEKENLKQLGLDAEKLLRELKELHDAAVSANAEQEHLKVATQEATKKNVGLTRELHGKASSVLDMVMGAYGKNSSDSKIIGRMRSKIRRGRNHESSEQGTVAASVD